jgi:hypothetical protein
MNNEVLQQRTVQFLLEILMLSGQLNQGTYDGYTSSLGVGRGANNPSP